MEFCVAQVPLRYFNLREVGTLNQLWGPARLLDPKLDAW